MSILSVNVVVPSVGDGPIADVSNLVGPKTVLLSGSFTGSYILMGSQNNVDFVPLLQFDSAQGIEQTMSESFSSFRLRSLATSNGIVVCNVSAIAGFGENYFGVVASLVAGFKGLTTIIDTYSLFPPTGLEGDMCLMCRGLFSGQINVLGSMDGINFSPVCTFRIDATSTDSHPIEFSPIGTPDKLRYLRLSVDGVTTGNTTVTVGGTIPATPASGEFDSVDNMALLRSLTQRPPVVNVLGFYTNGDQGGGLFEWNASSTTSDNGGTVILPTGASPAAPGRWLRQYSGSLNVRWFGAKGDSVTDDHSAFNLAYLAAIAGPPTYYSPPGTTYQSTPANCSAYVPPGATYKIKSPLVFAASGFSLIGDNKLTTQLDFSFTVPNTQDAVSFIGNPLPPEPFLSTCRLANISLVSSNNTVRDFVHISTYDDVEIEKIDTTGPGRYGIRLDTCVFTRISDSILKNNSSGISCLRVENGCTTTMCVRTYFTLAKIGPGADVVNTGFTDCVFESNGTDYAYNSHGVQDPLNGVGLLGRHGWITLTGGHFENNAGHAICLGTDGMTTAVINGPFLSGDTTNFTQPRAAAIWADQVVSGAFIGILPDMVRSIVFTANSSNVAVLGLNTQIVPGSYAPPEYLPSDISNYPGIVQFNDYYSGINLFLGGQGNTNGMAIGSILIRKNNPTVPGSTLLPGKIYFDQVLDRSPASQQKYFWYSDDSGEYQLVGGKLAMDSSSSSTPGNSAIINKPTGSFIAASGTTSFTLTNSLISASSIVIVTIQQNDATAVVKNVVPTGGSCVINLTAPSADTKMGFILLN